MAFLGYAIIDTSAPPAPLAEGALDGSTSKARLKLVTLELAPPQQAFEVLIAVWTDPPCLPGIFRSGAVPFLQVLSAETKLRPTKFAVLMIPPGGKGLKGNEVHGDVFQKRLLSPQPPVVFFDCYGYSSLFRVAPPAKTRARSHFRGCGSTSTSPERQKDIHLPAEKHGTRRYCPGRQPSAVRRFRYAMPHRYTG